MALPPLLQTPRLTLRPGSAEQLRRSIGPHVALAEALACDVAPDWPPKHWEQAPVDWLLVRMADHPDEPFWRAWLVLLRRETAPDLLVGTAGFKGPPGPTTGDPNAGAGGGDSGGVVEVGYSVVTSHWRRGIATEAVGALLAWAAGDPRVRAIRAHTLAGDPASGGVLIKNGFVKTATVCDPEDGEIDRYERPARS